MKELQQEKGIHGGGGPVAQGTCFDLVLCQRELKYLRICCSCKLMRIMRKPTYSGRGQVLRGKRENQLHCTKAGLVYKWGFRLT